MDKLRALSYFVASAEEGSFAGAARRLGLSVPAVQKSVTALEQSLGVRLFERSVRGLSLTTSGQTYLEGCQPLLAELMAVDETLRRSAQRPTGTLVIAAHSQLALHLLLPALPRFHARYPDIQIDVRVIHRLTDADAQVADLFVLHGWPEANDLVHRQLGHTRTLVVGAPDYWAARGIPAHPGELERHTCVLMRNPAGIVIDLWEFERAAETVSVKVNGWLCSNGREVVLAGVLAGEGIARLNHMTTRVHQQSGRLIPVLLDWEVKGGPPVSVLYRPNQRRTARVRLFLEFVTALLRDIEAEDPIRAERPHWHRDCPSQAFSALRTRANPRGGGGASS
jgi:LysR family transcriptional regulator, regulator for bpeEF and oprC